MYRTGVPRVKLINTDTYLGWLELLLTGTNFHGPKPVRATEVLLYLQLQYIVVVSLHVKMVKLPCSAVTIFCRDIDLCTNSDSTLLQQYVPSLHPVNTQRCYNVYSTLSKPMTFGQLCVDAVQRRVFTGQRQQLQSGS